MLIEFRVANHRSLRDEQVLTFEEQRAGTADPPYAREVPGHKKRLLPAAAIYGANASGKSNVLSALAFMHSCLIRTDLLWGEGERVPRQPFAWDGMQSRPSLFEVVFVARGVRYQYGFVASDERFEEEWLYSWPEGHKQRWFQREADNFEFGDKLGGENELIASVTRPNVLFLTMAVQHAHKQLTTPFWKLGAILVHNTRSRVDMILHHPDADYVLGDFGLKPRSPLSGLFESAPETVDDRNARRSGVLRLLKDADFGVVDVRVESEPPTRGKPLRRPVGDRVFLKHVADDPDAWLSLAEESRGTQSAFLAAFPILSALESGRLLLLDELEASLHPELARRIVRMFNDPATNPNNAQLLFTTHDTNLIGTTHGPAELRRDQVWFTEKDPRGGTVLYPLSDFQPRKAENLERGYLQGRYGAVPFLGDFAFAGE